MQFTPEFRRRFWSKVIKDGPIPAHRPELGVCWLWTAGRTKAGYGQIQARKVAAAPILAHRAAWEMEHGPTSLHVLHQCDNPACVRPSHLIEGTQRDNNQDRHRKGRTASGDRNGARTKPWANPFFRNRGSGLRGERHPMAKLSSAQVQAIKERFAKGGIRKATLAREYGVSQTQIGRIIKGVSYGEN